jgi:hypothetical protein
MRPGSLALVVSTLVATLVCTLMLRDALQTALAPSAYAVSRGPDPAGRTYQNGNNNDNAEDGDNADGDNDDGDNEDFDNEDDFDLGPYPPLSPPSSGRQPEPVCSTPGRATVFTSFDQKVSVRVPESSPRPVRVELLLVINAHEAPSPPGFFVYPLAYEVQAGYCGADPLSTFPTEVALAIRYTDIEVTSLNESRFVIGRLDLATGVWVPMAQSAADPAANVVTATITEPGYYMVWEAR